MALCDLNLSIRAPLYLQKAFIPLLLCCIHVSSRIENAKMGSAISLFTSSDDNQTHPVSFQG